MKKEIILLSVLCIIILYVFTIHKIEEMTNSSDTTETPGTTEQIKEAVKQIYLADVESIRNLSNVASKLQTNGLNIPGTITASDLNIVNGNASGTFNFGSKANINSLGDIIGNSLTVSGNMVGNNLTVTGLTNITGRLLTPSGHTIQCLGRQHIAGDESLYLLYKHGLIVGKERGSSGNATIQGKLTVNDSLTVNGVTFDTNKNKARYIRVGNMKSIDIINRNTGKKSINNISPLAVKNYWTLIEIRVLDKNGVNVAELKDVTQIYGSPIANTSPLNITNGKIFPDSSKPSKDNYLDGYVGGTGTHQLEIDLGIEIDIDAIELYNRYEGRKDENKSSPTYDIDIEARMNGTIVELINGNKDIINRTIHTGLWHRTYSKEYIL
jgi:hypothetical protein